jgi:hypothetical protein
MVVKHHRSEKRVGLALDKRTYACIMFRATPKDKLHVKPHLLFEMKMEYCIVCNHQHWIFGDPIELEPASNPKLGWMQKTGYE